MKPIPKSLHTVTVLVAVAQHYMQSQQTQMASIAVDAALHILGYADSPDTYELVSKARAILSKSVQA